MATKTILIVEDNAGTRDGLAALLARHGYATQTARDGGEALDILYRGPPPDLVLLDMLLPVQDGWRILPRLKNAIPVIIMTGTVLSPEWAAEHGAAGFLKKPIEDSDLLAEVRRALNE
jgi:CheY-like chemotaxis protein